MQSLSRLSDDALLQDLHAIAGSHRKLTAELVFYLGEMDARRLHLKKAFSSLFSYCVEELRFSEDEACRRIDAARLARRFPSIYSLLSSGLVSLTVLGLIKPHLTNDNHRELFALVSGVSVREAKERLAAQFPRPDVPSMIRKLPESRTVCATAPPAASEFGPAAAPPAFGVGPATAPAAATAFASVAAPPAASALAPATAPAAAVVLVPPASASHPAPLWPDAAREHAARVSSRSHVEPLSRDRFLVKFTASRAVKEKLEVARDLMRHESPSGDLAVVVERALDVLVRELRKEKQGRTTRVLDSPRAARASHVTDAARREVVERDGWQCSFVAEDGRRCGARGFLEFDHRVPRGCGGSSRPENLRLLCRGHNQFEADRAYGAELMSRAIRRERLKRSVRSHTAIHAESPAALSSGNDGQPMTSEPGLVTPDERSVREGRRAALDGQRRSRPCMTGNP
jgi:5-methylcytosine-specific restriction endonuclease McrA